VKGTETNAARTGGAGGAVSHGGVPLVKGTETECFRYRLHRRQRHGGVPLVKGTETEKVRGFDQLIASATEVSPS